MAAVSTREQQFYEFDDFRIDAVRRLLFLRGAPVRLKPRVFDTLLYLASHQGKVLDKDELMNAIWPDATVEENNLNQSVSMLRARLGRKSRGKPVYRDYSGPGLSICRRRKDNCGAGCREPAEGSAHACPGAAEFATNKYFICAAEQVG